MSYGKLWVNQDTAGTVEEVEREARGIFSMGSNNAFKLFDYARFNTPIDRSRNFRRGELILAHGSRFVHQL